MPARKNFKIITAKTLPPQKRGKQVSRHNESLLLKQVSEARLCCVVAPPGYGKTNILSRSFRHLNNLGYLVAWVSFDAQDNQFYRFLSYVLASLQQVSALKREWRDLLLDTYLEDQGDHLLSSLIEELSDSDNDLYLILDDFHHIQDRQIHDFLKRLLDYAPYNFHLIIGSRQRLDVSFYRSVQHSTYVEIGSSQLQLNLTDTQHFFKDCCDMELSPAEVERWHRDTEGWVFPLKLASISIKQRPGFALGDLLQKDRGISEYLSDEILAGMSKPFANFLMAIAVPDIFCIEACGYIAGVANPHEFLEQVQSQNLFIERLSSDGEWFQLHPFFRSYLEARLAKESPGLLISLHRKSREWFEQNNMPSYAIKHAIDAGESKLLASLLEKSCYDLLLNGQYMELVGWAQLLGDEDTRSRPKLCFAVAFNYILMHRFEDGRRLIESLTDSAKLRRQLGEFSDGLPILLGLDAGFRDDVDAAMTHCRDWLKTIESPSKTLPLLLITGCNILSYCMLYKGRFAEALDVQVSWKAVPENELPAYGIAYANCLEGLVKLHSGDIAEADRAFIRAGKVAVEKLGEFSIYSSFPTAFLCEIRYQQGDFRFLLEEVLPSLDTISKIGLVDSLIHSFPLVASALHFNGRYVEANEVLDRAESIARLCGWPRLALACMHQKLRYAIENRASIDRQLINSKVEKIEVDAGKRLNISAQYYLVLIKAESCAATGQFNDAIDLVFSFHNVLIEKSFLYLAFLCKVRLAFFYDINGDQDKAINVLKECFDFAASAKLTQAFVDASYISPSLLKVYGNSTVLGSHVEMLTEINSQISSHGKLKDSSHEAKPVDSVEIDLNVSEREVEILELLGQGLTNKLIARSLSIGQETVKWHIKNIFGKLEVNSRVNAVQKGRRLGLIA
ncbi:helix-turn-helix transcriptional regulator [Zhongshania arctica]|uniref:LuxR C-terminal-related transcriptional regulator n=1 Tax=Zhongshania arctica TaxID=3238302 RepID=A0ABV3TUJ6_9GAMM